MRKKLLTVWLTTMIILGFLTMMTGMMAIFSISVTASNNTQPVPLEIWHKSYDGGDYDIASDVATDSGDNVIVTGYSMLGGNPDYYTIKYDSAGNVVWSKSYDGGEYYNHALGVATDSGDNIIVTGETYLSGDFDYYTIKYNSNGVEQWNRTYDGGDYDSATSVAVDSIDNIIVTGESCLGEDNDYYTICYDSMGNELGYQIYDGGYGDYAYGVAVNSMDNIIVTGGSVLPGNLEDYYTIKYRNSDVIPPITITSPVGSEDWTGGTVHDIIWIYNGANETDGKVWLNYTTNGGMSYTPISGAQGISPDSSPYLWTIPTIDNDTVQINATIQNTTSGLKGYDMCNQFTIDSTAPTVQSASPTNESINVNVTTNIEIIFSEAMNQSSVEDAFSIYPVVSGEKSWSDGNNLIFNPYSNLAWNTTYWVNISKDAKDDSDPGNPLVLFNSTWFKTKTVIVDNPPSVTVTAPDGGETWENGTQQDITWNATDDNPLPSNPINISYSANNGLTWNTIKEGEANDGTYIWTIPYVSTTLSNCLVKVTCYDTQLKETSDQSNSTFTIKNGSVAVDNPPSVTVISPNGGETWINDTQHDITWTATDDQTLPTNPINISYSTNGGTTWNSIANGEPNDGTYSWTVPDDPSTNCLVNVTCYDSIGQTGSDESNNTFTIKRPIEKPPNVTVTSPNGGETWIVGTTHDITWIIVDDNPLPPNPINVSYSTNGGSSWTPISGAQGLPNTTTSYGWTVPDEPSTNCLVKVTCYDSGGQENFDVSNTLFEIRQWSSDNPPTVTVIKPNGGETWYIGSQYNILWVAEDDHPLPSNPVNISVSRNNGNSWTSIVNGEANDGTYNWMVTGPESTQCLIRVTCYDSSGQTNLDTSNSVFTISAEIGTITGVVTDQDTNESIQGAIVIVENYPWLNDTTNETGYYKIENVPPGPQNIIVTRTGYKNKTVNITVEAGVNILNIKLEKESVSGGPAEEEFPWLWIVIGIIAGILIIVLLLFLSKRIEKKPSKLPPPPL